MTRKSIALALIAVSAAACGGTNSPTSPSSTRASAVTVTLPTALVVGSTQQATATMTMPDGSTQPVSTGFQSDVPTVASVTTTGLVSAITGGTANIYVIAGGQQGTKAIRVVPNYQGTWRGSYVVRSCTQTGAFADQNTCNGQLNRVLPVVLSLNQSLDAVNGTFFLGTVAFTSFNSSVDGDGSLSFAGSTTDASSISIAANWRVMSPQTGRITGRHTQVWRASSGGEMRWDAEIVDWLNNIGPASTTRAVRRVLSLDDLLRALAVP